MTDIWVLLSVGSTNVRVCGTATDDDTATGWTRSSHWRYAVRVPYNGVADGEIKPVPWNEDNGNV